MNIIFDENISDAFNLLGHLFSSDCLEHYVDFPSYPIELEKEVQEYWKQKSIYDYSNNRHYARRYKFALLDLRQKALKLILEQENVFGLIEEQREEAIAFAFWEGVNNGIGII